MSIAAGQMRACDTSCRRWHDYPTARVVAITGASFAADTPAWRDVFVYVQEAASSSRRR
jgi:hypothetical protein